MKLDYLQAKNQLPYESKLLIEDSGYKIGFVSWNYYLLILQELFCSFLIQYIVEIMHFGNHMFLMFFYQNEK